MKPEMHQHIADALRHGQQQIQSLLDQHMHQLKTESCTGTDEAKTVSVTLDARQRLKDVHIQDGLLRLGIETVAHRINEAIRDAQATLAATNGAERQLLESIPGPPEFFKQLLGSP